MNERNQIELAFGEGFFLSPIVRGDKRAYLEHFADPEISRNTLAISFPYHEADADWWLDRCEEAAKLPLTRFAVREPSGYLIGGIGLVELLTPDAHRAEFGYWLARGYRGRGLMPRVINAFAGYAFGSLGLHRLYATAFASNLASHRALEKAGFLREGLLRQHHRKDGVYLDAVIYGRIADARGDDSERGA